MNTASQLFMAGLGHLVMVSNGQLLTEGSFSVIHRWSGLSCNGKQWTTVT